jgi:hypothetical protein
MDDAKLVGPIVAMILERPHLRPLHLGSDQRHEAGHPQGHEANGPHRARRDAPGGALPGLWLDARTGPRGIPARELKVTSA